MNFNFLFDNEQIMEAYGREERREGWQKGQAEGKELQAKKMALNLHSLGITTDNIAKAAEVSVEKVQEWLSEPQMSPAN